MVDVKISGSTTSTTESLACNALHSVSDSTDCHMLCNLLHSLHASGDQISLTIHPARAKRYPPLLLMIPWFTVLKFIPATSHPLPPTPKRVTPVRFKMVKLFEVRYGAGFTTLDVFAFIEGLLAIK